MSSEISVNWRVTMVVWYNAVRAVVKYVQFPVKCSAKYNIKRHDYTCDKFS